MPSGSADPIVPTEVEGARWRPAVIGPAAAFAVVVICRAIEATPGESLALRWLRVAADHPVRTAFAATLGCLALAPRSRIQAKEVHAPPP